MPEQVPARQTSAQDLAHYKYETVLLSGLGISVLERLLDIIFCSGDDCGLHLEKIKILRIQKWQTKTRCWFNMRVSLGLFFRVKLALFARISMG